MAIDIQGSVTFLGTVDIQTTAGNPADGTSGDVTFDGSKALAGASGASYSGVGGIAPVPFPPPSGTPFSDCTSNFSTNDVLIAANPNTTVTANGVAIVILGAMFLLKKTVPCQPVIGIGTGKALMPTPVMIIGDNQTSPGAMNGVGFGDP